MSDSSPKVREIFDKAIDFDSETERAAWLDRVCGEDSTFRAEVDQLLSAYDRTDDFMRQPVVSLGERVTRATYSKLPEFPSRYRPVGEMDRGGMGVVWRVNDQQFDRPLAIKIMLPELAGDADAQGRFERESQITGSLQHPAIPPVVDRGILENSTPYFSMRFVEGQTLAEMLRHRKDVHSDLPRFLHVFEQVCQAVGYAHSQGVVHRDLKPQNVMVGAFGEVQVIDWGMAKQISEREPAFDAEDTTVDFFVNANEHEDDTGTSAESVTLTRAGQVLGTLAYMPPEQARGEWDQVDARADVFSLGGILCKILTDHPPYFGDDRMDVYRRVVAGELDATFALIDQSKVDSELVPLCRSCLDPNPQKRPSDASKIAERIQQYQEALTERLEQERTERATTELRLVEEQKRRRLTFVLAVATIAFIVGIGGMAWWIQQGRTAAAARITRARNDIDQSLQRASELRENHQFEAATTLFEQAELRLAEIPDNQTLALQVRSARADLEVTRKLDEIRITKSDVGAGFAHGPTGAFAQAFKEYGIDIFGDQSPEDLAARIATSDVADHLIAAIDNWALEDRDSRPRLLNIVRLADPDPLRDKLRDIENYSNSEILLEAASQVDVGSLSPAMIDSLAARLYLIGQPAAAAELLTRATIKYPGDFWLHLNAADAFDPEMAKELEFQNNADTLSHVRASIAIRPENPSFHMYLSELLHRMGRRVEAEAVFRHVIETFPDYYADAVAKRAGMLAKDGKDEEAEKEYRIALEDGRLKNPARVHLEYGYLLLRTGKHPEARTQFEAALKINPDYAEAHQNLGATLDRLGLPEQAVAAYRRAIELDDSLAIAHYNVGNYQWRTGELSEAEKAFRKAIERDPKMAMALSDLGFLLFATKREEEAEGFFRSAIDADPNYAPGHANLGLLLWQSGRLDEGEAAMRHVLELDSISPDNRCNLGLLLNETNRAEEAESILRESTKVAPQHPESFFNLGLVLLRYTDRFEEAEESIKHSAKLAIGRRDLQPTIQEVLALAARAVEMKRQIAAGREPGDAFTRLVCGDILRRQGKLQMAFDLLDSGLADDNVPETARVIYRYCAARTALRLANETSRSVDEESVHLPASELRAQALEWLNENLESWVRLGAKNPNKPASAIPITHPAAPRPVHPRYWSGDKDLASVYESNLAALPDPEQVGWQKLWEDVENFTSGKAEQNSP